MKLSLVFAVGSLLAVQSSLSHAAESDTATVRLSHGVLKYSMLKNETKVGSVKTIDEDVQAIDTFPAGIEIATFVKGYALYAYPLQQNGTSFWLGKSINSSMELGATALFGSRTVKDGAEASRHSIGAYLWWTTPISSSANFELNLNPALLFGSGKTPATAGATPTAEAKSELSGFTLYFDALAVIPIAKNFEYAAGLTYDLENSENEVKQSGVTSKAKTNNSGLGIMLAKFRYSI